jgi:3-phenylpropionate/cinnamic acid dioxygenase small subunit
VEKWLNDMLILYDDGTPRTRHLMTNIAIEIDESARTASSRAYVTALQAAPTLPLQPIVAGTYHDRFAVENGKWRFTERRVVIDLVGDISKHLRPAPKP